MRRMIRHAESAAALRRWRRWRASCFFFLSSATAVVLGLFSLFGRTEYTLGLKLSWRSFGAVIVTPNDLRVLRCLYPVDTPGDAFKNPVLEQCIADMAAMPWLDATARRAGPLSANAPAFFRGDIVRNSASHGEGLYIRSWLVESFVVIGAVISGYLLIKRLMPALPLHLCPACGYDLHGSVESERCPECGREIDAEQREHLGTLPGVEGESPVIGEA